MHGVVLGISPIRVLNSTPCVSGGFLESIKALLNETDGVIKLAS